MNKKIKDAAKVVYANSLKYKFVWDARNKYKRRLKKQKKRSYMKYISDTLNQFADIKLEDTTFTLASCKASENEDYVFGYDVLGQINDFDNIDISEYFSDLSNILKSDSIDIRIACTTNPDLDSETVKYLREELNLFIVDKDTSYLIDCDGFKVAVIGTYIDGDTDEEAEEPDLNQQTIKNIAYAQNNEVDYVMAYVLRNEANTITKSATERALIRKLANLGLNSIFASNAYGIHAGGNIKRTDGAFTNAYGSTGTLYGHHAEAEGSAVALRYKLVLSKSGEKYITNKGYMPLYTMPSMEKINHIVRIDYQNEEHRRNEKMMAALEYIENESGKLRDIRNILTINDICEILKVELPEEYQYLKNVTVGKVCSRSFEVNSGDVLFFREPFDDINDTEVKPLEVRMRIVEKARSRGARFIFSYVDLDPSIPHVKVEHAREAHITVCAHLRQMYPVKTIGITGSVGKTSTKDMMYNVLNEKYATYRNLRNSNTQVNIGLHIQEFKGGYEFFIQEIGGGRPGGASRHSRMILPEATVVTNIGDAHIGNFGSREAIMKSKLGIVDGMDSRGTLFLNGDDPLLRTVKLPVDTVFYGVDNKECDYYADNVIEENGKTFFDICHEDHVVPACLNVLGIYNVLNAVCCYAIGKKFGLSDAEIVAGISKFETSGVRQNLISVAGYNLFVDCFNASPASIDSSLSVLENIETEHKKIAIIGDVTGMAELAHDIHVEIGNIVKKYKMDTLICYGEESKAVYEIAKEAGINAVSFTEPKKLETYLMSIVEPGDVILFKGSSKMQLAERIDSMFGTMLSDQRYIDGVKYKTTTYNKVQYNLYPEYATVTGCNDYAGVINVAKSIRGRTVYNIGEGAFTEKENITGVKLNNNIRHIGEGAFNGCVTISNIILPKNVKFIGDKAFSDCTNLKQVTIPEGLMHIGEGAFSGCFALEELNLSGNVTEIGPNAFDQCENLLVKCPAGSYAEKYCIANGIYYKNN